MVKALLKPNVSIFPLARSIFHPSRLFWSVLASFVLTLDIVTAKTAKLTKNKYKEFNY